MTHDYIWFLDDCEYSEWTPWTPCTKGGYNRRRVIETECRGNGTPCDKDSLYDEKDCDNGTCPITDL